MTMTSFVTVADMIEALRALPADARLVVTESGYYSYSDLASICLPEPVSDIEEIPEGTAVYRIGHSHQSY